MSREIYNIAKVVREKLSSEVASRDHNLQRLVAHANMYDRLLAACYDSSESETDTDEESSSEDCPSDRSIQLSSLTQAEEASERRSALVSPPEDPGLLSCGGDIRAYGDADIDLSSDYSAVEVEEVEVTEDDS